MRLKQVNLAKVYVENLGEALSNRLKACIGFGRSYLLSKLGLDFKVDFSQTDEIFSHINAHLVLGIRPTPDDVDLLKEMNVTHVISCLESTKKAQVSFLSEHFDTLFLPVRDSIHESINDPIKAGSEFVLNALNMDPNSRILVHCEAGVSRSATLVLALEMKRNALSFIDAFYRVRQSRAKILPNIGFATQLQQFEQSLRATEAQTEGVSSLAQYLKEVCHVPAEIELIESMLVSHHYDAERAIRAIFGDDIPRVVQGVRV